MGKLPFEDEWLEGMRNEDGVLLMEYLMKEPGLMSVTHRGCNVLHLAVRHNWYGLVLEILDRRKINIPNVDAEASVSAEGVLPESRNEDGNSSHSLDLTAITINLLTAKEGDGYWAQRLSMPKKGKEGDGATSDTTDVYYASGLDVLGMAEIQCHHAINSALANFVWDVRHRLGKDHPYVAYNISNHEEHSSSSQVPVGAVNRNHEESSLLGSSSSRDSQVPVGANNEESPKETLRRYVRKRFPDSSLVNWISLNDAPNSTSLGHGGTMSDSSQESRSSEFHSHPLIVRQWMVTAPFLSLSEFFFLECNRIWGEVRTEYNFKFRGYNTWNKPTWNKFKVGLRQDNYHMLLLGEDIMGDFEKEEVWTSTGGKLQGLSFFKYLMNISDTRRTAFQYGLINGLGLGGENGSLACPILYLYSRLDGANLEEPSASNEDLLNEFEVCFNMHDGSGRTLFHILLASNLDIQESMWHYGRSSMWAKLRPRFDCNKRWYSAGRDWHFNHKWWKTNVECVHAANGLHGWEEFKQFWRQVRMSADQIILTSAHLSGDQRRERLRLLLDRKLFLDLRLVTFFARLQVRTGVVNARLMTSLNYAVLVGDTATAELLAKDTRIYDSARIRDGMDSFLRVNYNDPLKPLFESENCPYSCLHLAAERGDLEMIRAILDTGEFDLHYKLLGESILHPAVRCQEMSSVPVMLHDFVEIPKIRMHLQSDLSEPEGTAITTEQQREKALNLESNRQGCVNFLLQVGLDAWETDKNNRIADPGPKGSRGFKAWWYDKLAQEMQEQKVNFGAAANAVSVTAALVATASYVGPLQPPLGLNFVDDDNVAKVQVDMFSVRIFVVCNNLAFFFALVAIMLSLTPSLPMPKESLLEEVKRMRRSITSGLIALIVSLIAIFIAFASASIAVIPNKGGWNHGGLSFSTLVIGCLICTSAMFLCCVRAVRLLFHNNVAVRRFYKRVVFL